MATPDSDPEDFPLGPRSKKGRRRRRSRIRSSASDPQLNKRRLRLVEFTGSPRFPTDHLRSVLEAQ